jgi:ribulose-phosphate 3-epimerase
MAKPYLITPSILSADFTRLGEQISKVEANGASWIHIDVMDGHYVPNITMGPFIVETCRRITNLPLDVHLMIEAPERLLETFAQAGANHLSVHIETCPHIHRTLSTIRQIGCRPGVVLNPGTPASAIQEVLHLADTVLVMTVNPGYSGQTYIPEMLPKIRKVRRMLDEVNPHAMIQVDGGITVDTLPKTLDAGAQVFVAATAVFKHTEGISAGMSDLIKCFPD